MFTETSISYYLTLPILSHPSFRNYEIPFLGASSLPVAQQITLQDLYVSVRNEQVILRSKRLNKLVIPRLSNAHNYSNQALPVYQFLCDLQHQGLHTKLGLNLGNWADKCPFFPRIRYQNVIFRAATWHISSSAPFLENDEDKTKKHLMVMADGDNELLIDWQNPLLVAAWHDAAKKRDKILLKEFLYEPAQDYISQFIAVLIRQKATCFPEITANSVALNTERTFVVGSEWLYFKLYGGVKTADRVLADNIKPLCERLSIDSLIDKWFFVRYNDPEPHLRLRFHLTDVAQTGEVIALAHEHLQPALQLKYLYKIQTDTYQRELERYGFGMIEYSETIFCYQSEAIIAFLSENEGDAQEELRWQWAIQMIDALLRTFRYELPQKMVLLYRLKSSFAEEFEVDSLLRQQIDRKYRTLKPRFQDFLNETSSDFQQKNNYKLDAAVFLILESDLPIDNLMSSYIHMLLNRLFVTQQRLHELVIYDFLHRYYKTCSVQATQLMAAPKYARATPNLVI